MMPDMEKVIKGLHDLRRYLEDKEWSDKIAGAYVEIVIDTITLLKEQKVRELTIEEWYEWKTNQRRDPICLLWEHDTTPMWVLNPNDIHEPALLMGKLKLFTGKPTFEQCKEVKWE